MMLIGRRRTLSILLAIAVTAGGCGTMHHFIPPVPPKPGSGALMIGITWAPHEIYPVTLQASSYLAVGSNDIVGIGFCNFIIPNNLSYVHYGKVDEGNRIIYQLHANHILFDSFDPAYEADIGLATDRGAFQGTGKLGIAWFGEGPFPLGRGYFGDHSGFTPVAGLDLWWENIILSADVYPGMTSHFARGWHDMNEEMIRGEIASLKVIQGVVAEEELDNGWRFTLASGIVYKLAPAVADWWVEGIDIPSATTWKLRKFVGQGALPLWSLARLDSAGRGIPPKLFHLDAPKAVAEYHATGRLVLRDTPRTIEPIRWGLDDITIGLGFRPVSPER